MGPLIPPSLGYHPLVKPLLFDPFPVLTQALLQWRPTARAGDPTSTGYSGRCRPWPASSLAYGSTASSGDSGGSGGTTISSSLLGWVFPPVPVSPRRWGQDLTCPQLCSLANNVIISISITLGFGQHLDFILATKPQNLTPIAQLAVCSLVISILGSVASKTSFAITLLRISDCWMRAALWAIIISMNVVMLMTIVLQFIQCAPVEKFWKPFTPGYCWDPSVFTSYTIFSSTYSGAMDILLAILPWKIILATHIRTQEKFGVAVAMSMGFLFVAAPGRKRVTIDKLTVELYSAGLVSFVKAAQIGYMQSRDATCEHGPPPFFFPWR